MAISQVSVFTENRFGTIRNVTKVLGEAGIDIRALSVADTEGFGVLRMIVSNTKAAREILSKEECIVSVTPVLGVVIPDVPGGLSGVLNLLAQYKINIEYMYAFFSKLGDNVSAVLRVKEIEKVERFLEESGIAMLTENDLHA